MRRRWCPRPPDSRRTDGDWLRSWMTVFSGDPFSGINIVRYSEEIHLSKVQVAGWLAGWLTVLKPWRLSISKSKRTNLCRCLISRKMPVRGSRASCVRVTLTASLPKISYTCFDPNQRASKGPNILELAPNLHENQSIQVGSIRCREKERKQKKLPTLAINLDNESQDFQVAVVVVHV